MPARPEEHDFGGNDTVAAGSVGCISHNKSAIERLAVELQCLLLERLNPLSALRLACASRGLHRVVCHDDAFWRRRYGQLYVPESDFEAELPRLLHCTALYNSSWFNVIVRRELIEQRWRRGSGAVSLSPVSALASSTGMPYLCASAEYIAVSQQNRLFFSSSSSSSTASSNWREIHLPGHHYHHAKAESEARPPSSHEAAEPASAWSHPLLGNFQLRGPFLLAYIWCRTRQCTLCVWDLRHVMATADCAQACQPLAFYYSYTSILAGNYLVTEEKGTSTNKMLVRDLAATARRLPFGRPFAPSDPEVRQLVWPNGLASFGHCHDVDSRHEPVLLSVGRSQPGRAGSADTTVAMEHALWVSAADLTFSPRRNRTASGDNVIWWHSPVKVPLEGRPCWEVARFAAGHGDQLVLNCHVSAQHDRRTPMGFVLICCSLSTHERVWCRDEPERLSELFSFRGANRLAAATVSRHVRLFDLASGELLHTIAPDTFAGMNSQHPITLHRVIGELLAITSHGQSSCSHEADIEHGDDDGDDDTMEQLTLTMVDVNDGRVLWRKVLAQSIRQRPDDDDAAAPYHRHHYQHRGDNCLTEASICATRLCVYCSDNSQLLELNFAHGLI
ncbi:hypothetical protein SYNPS1DRAFT_28012 [Syncephalis pseudoplumigaleata]|uniref:F-box domain-containing protein n=1 Tax=Syncephalis pseudoplumigaleata TaxID=1712513 RepID=A0A4P9Z1I5_9FUNG|nr:hypothetical protein SYNPS1DRAFT_28012 [Syncephalis pseudoplumigaleata]|eukprot:RKP26294.1 hypothetical protein SYNPS1DRAFT_28012 [Syncephalis pseudoplumigaleata]